MQEGMRGLFSRITKSILERVENQFVRSPVDPGGEQGEIRISPERTDPEDRQISGVMEKEEFRAFIAQLDGAFEKSFRAGQLNTLIGKMSHLGDGETLSLVCPVGYRTEQTSLQVRAWGERGLLVLRMEGRGAPIELVEETFKRYRRPMEDAAEFRECRVTTEEYEGLLDLRFRELRAPLGLRWTVEDLQREQLERHFGVFLLDQPVATMVIRRLRDGVVRLRQIAVSNEHRGKGYGRMVMKEIETLLASEGMKEFELHAREDVVGFYEKLGFEQVGSIFTEIGLPHVLMRKRIKPNE